MVFRLECPVVLGAGHLSYDYLRSLRPGEDVRIDPHQFETRHQVRAPAGIDGSPHCSCLLHDRIEHAAAYVYSSLCERYFPSRTRDIRQFALTDGDWIDLRVIDCCGIRKYAQQRPVCPDHTDHIRDWNCRILTVTLTAYQLHHAGAGGRIDDGGVRDRDLAGSTHHHE